MLGPLLCGRVSPAPLLPKLRGHFAEFLDNASSAGLGILSPSTCVGLRYGRAWSHSGFSRRAVPALRYFLFAPARAAASPGVLGARGRPRLGRASRSRLAASARVPASSVHARHRILRLSPLGCASPPRLRPRLPQGRSASPWNPWTFGREDSHLPLATHSGILPSRSSTAPSGGGFRAAGMLPYRRALSRAPRGFGGAFQPRTFSARGLSTSELLRTL